MNEKIKFKEIKIKIEQDEKIYFQNKNIKNESISNKPNLNLDEDNKEEEDTNLINTKKINDNNQNIRNQKKKNSLINKLIIDDIDLNKLNTSISSKSPKRSKNMDNDNSYKNNEKFLNKKMQSYSHGSRGISDEFKKLDLRKLV